MFKKKTRRAGLVLTPLVMVALAACSGGGAPDPGTGGEAGEVIEGGDLVIAALGAGGNLDPTLATSQVDRLMLWNLCDRLYEMAPDGSVEPSLAAALPEFSDDATSATITIRPDLLFQDGTPMDAEAVKKTLERHATHPESVRTSFINVLGSVEVVDDLTVKLNLTKPYSPLAAELADYTGIILSPAAIDDAAADLTRNPVCVGPFVVESWTQGIETVMTKAETYFDADKVNLDSVTWRAITDENVRVQNLLSGDVDIASHVSPLQRQQVENSADVTLEVSPGLGYWGISVNTGNTDGIGSPPQAPDTPMAQYPELREAFELALDREAINQAVHQGQYEVECQPFGEAHSFHREVDCTPYDPEAAKELIEETGLPTPIPVTLNTTNFPEEIRLGEVIQEMVAAVGFEVTINTMDGTGANQAGIAGNYDIHTTGWTGRVDPDQTMAATVRTAGAWNFPNFADPEIDALLDDATAVTDMDERADIYYEVLDAYLKERAFIYLYIPTIAMGYANDVYPGRLMSHGTILVKEAGFLG